MSLHQGALLVILLMAVVTYLTRVGGLLFANRVRLVGRSKTAFDAISRAILTALIAPAVLTSGPAEAMAGLFTILAATRLPLLGTMLVGVVAIVIFRGLFSS